jgi:bifunctional UDP-N-acetylglucosamine pyrophosphorylase/glucosamine-1-phosphate N-acetyltransferase
MKNIYTNKLLLNIADKPMIVYTVEMLEKAKLFPIIVVIDFYKDRLCDSLKDRVVYAEETNQLGTGHTTSIALKAMPESNSLVLFFFGDHAAFYEPAINEALADKHFKSDAVMTL